LHAADGRDRFRGGTMSYRCGWACAFLVLVILVGIVLPALAAGAEDSHEQAAIRALLEAQAKAWNAGDMEGFMAGYWKSNETEFVGAGGILRGWQAVLDRYRRTYPDRKAMGRLTFSDLEINVVSRDAAYIVGRWQLEREKDNPGGVFTLVVRKFPEGWRIVHDHTSAFASPASSERK
jgi:ketosteroid isomerase-like protein